MGRLDLPDKWRDEDDMTHPSKRKGDSAELEVQTMIREELGVPARRALGAGRKDDMGDIDGVPDTAIQVTNTQDLSAAVTRKLPELDQQMLNKGATHGALFCRRRGGKWIVVLTPEMWFALIRETVEMPAPPDQLDGQLVIDE